MENARSWCSMFTAVTPRLRGPPRYLRGKTPNAQLPTSNAQFRASIPQFDVRCSMFAAVMGICRIVTVTIIATHIDDPTPAVLCHCAAIAPRSTGTA